MNAPIRRVLPTPVARAKHSDGNSRSKSSGGANNPNPVPGVSQTKELLPQAIRLVMTLGPDSGFVGAITRDVIMPPQPNQGS